MPSFAIHWLTVTSRMSVEDVMAQFSLGDPHGSKGWGIPEPKGGYGQPSRVVHECGLVVYFGSPRPDQPVTLVASGEVCERIDISRVLVCGWRVTRFDVAADIEVSDAGVVVQALARDALSGRLEAPSHAVRELVDHSPGGGHTTYLGSPSSHLMLRAYSRRGPVRFEFQVKPHRQVAQFYRERLLERSADVIWRGLASEFRWDHPAWAELMRGEVVLPPAVEASATELNRTITALRLQYGVLLRMLQAAGYTLADFADDRLPSAMAFNRCLRLADGLPEGSYEQALRHLEALRPRIPHRHARLRPSDGSSV